MSPTHKEMLSRARSLRREMTPQERKLWYRFLRTYPQKFYRQRILGGYIADFYCAAAKLVVELDGSQHYLEAGNDYDRRRDAFLAAKGLQILRFSNREMDREFPAVCTAIHNAVQARIPHG